MIVIMIVIITRLFFLFFFFFFLLDKEGKLTWIKTSACSRFMRAVMMSSSTMTAAVARPTRRATRRRRENFIVEERKKKEGKTKKMKRKNEKKWKKNEKNEKRRCLNPWKRKRKWKGASLEDPEDCHGDVEWRFLIFFAFLGSGERNRRSRAGENPEKKPTSLLLLLSSRLVMLNG